MNNLNSSASTPAGLRTRDFDSIKSNIENAAKDSGLDQSDAYWFILSELEILKKMVIDKDVIISYLESKILKLRL